MAAKKTRLMRYIGQSVFHRLIFSRPIVRYHLDNVATGVFMIYVLFFVQDYEMYHTNDAPKEEEEDEDGNIVRVCIVPIVCILSFILAEKKCLGSLRLSVSQHSSFRTSSRF